MRPSRLLSHPSLNSRHSRRQGRHSMARRSRRNRLIREFLVEHVSRDGCRYEFVCCYDEYRIREELSVRQASWQHRIRWRLHRFVRSRVCSLLAEKNQRTVRNPIASRRFRCRLLTSDCWLNTNAELIKLNVSDCLGERPPMVHTGIPSAHRVVVN